MYEKLGEHPEYVQQLTEHTMQPAALQALVGNINHSNEEVSTR